MGPLAPGLADRLRMLLPERAPASHPTSMERWRDWRVVLLLALAALSLTWPLSSDRPAPAAQAGHSLLDADAVRETIPRSAQQRAVAIDPQTAREINAARPFADLGPEQPRPFQLDPAGTDFSRAVDCLASAMLYEAGDEQVGQSAVAQVVLNRVRHPAFPHSVCAVVYQGSERATGCQFTFTCDGALRRPPSPAAWQRARVGAGRFLRGAIDPAVGMATHYHTDWVHPYWSASLDKIAKVGTHLFFRWRGAWGHRAAFSSAYAGSEGVVGKLASLSPARHSSGAPHLETETDGLLAGPRTLLPRAKLLAAGTGDHFILVDATGDGRMLAMQGLGHCTGQTYCKVVGWDRRSQGYGSPATPLIRSVAFLYVSDKRTGVEVVLWDCVRYNRPSESQCLNEANRRWISFEGDLSRAS